MVSSASLAFEPDATAIPTNTGIVVLQNKIDNAANIAIARKARQADTTVPLNAALATQLASGSEFEATIHYAQAAAAIYVSTEAEKRDGIRPVHIRAKLGED